jgi:CheY-like chemotaxis protein
MGEAASAGTTVLVVEDNGILREELGVVLERAGHTVALAEDGQQALDWLAAHPAPGVVLLDMLLPVLDGWRFLERWPRLGLPSRVIVTTGLTTVGQEWCLTHGCAGFLLKPVEPESLLTEVRRCLGEDGPGPSQANPDAP